MNGETNTALGGTLSYGGTSQGVINAGSYTIIPTGLTSANYIIGFSDGTLVITVPPTPPIIQPPIVDGTGTGTNLILRVATQSGFSYVLHSTTNLTPPVVRLPMATNPGKGGTITNSVPVGFGPPQQFFR